MKFGQLIEYSVRNIFLKKSCRKWGSKTSSRHLLSSKKALYQVKAKVVSALVLIYIGTPRLAHTIKSWRFRLLIQRYGKFRFFNKGTRASFSLTFCICFSCCILLTDRIHYLVVIASWDNGQYVRCNYLLSSP